MKRNELTKAFQIDDFKLKKKLWSPWFKLYCQQLESALWKFPPKYFSVVRDNAVIV